MGFYVDGSISKGKWILQLLNLVGLRSVNVKRYSIFWGVLCFVIGDPEIVGVFFPVMCVVRLVLW